MSYQVGEQRGLRNAPEFSLFHDTSWDGRGTVIICHDEDIVQFRRGNAQFMGTLILKEGAKTIRGEQCYRLQEFNSAQLQALIS